MTKYNDGTECIRSTESAPRKTSRPTLARLVPRSHWLQPLLRIRASTVITLDAISTSATERELCQLHGENSNDSYELLRRLLRMEGREDHEQSQSSTFGWRITCSSRNCCPWTLSRRTMLAMPQTPRSGARFAPSKMIASSSWLYPPMVIWPPRFMTLLADLNERESYIFSVTHFYTPSFVLDSFLVLCCRYSF